jgi:RNase P protein component
LSEAVRLLWDVIDPGWDLVWIARPAINEAEFAALQQASVRLLRRAKVLRTDQDPPDSPSGIRAQSASDASMVPVGSDSGVDKQL